MNRGQIKRVGADTVWTGRNRVWSVGPEVRMSR
jgi:hypothetical protein